MLVESESSPITTLFFKAAWSRPRGPLGSPHISQRVLILGGSQDWQSLGLRGNLLRAYFTVMALYQL